MAHWAEINEAGIVLRVTVGDNSDPDEGYGWLVDNLGGTWLKTSYNTHGGQHSEGGTAFRYNYAGLGFTFDPDFGPDGAFIPPKPFASWVLNPDTALWEAPTPMPTEGMWTWDESALGWVEIEPPA